MYYSISRRDGWRLEQSSKSTLVITSLPCPPTDRDDPTLSIVRLLPGETVGATITSEPGYAYTNISNNWITRVIEPD